MRFFLPSVRVLATLVAVVAPSSNRDVLHALLPSLDAEELARADALPPEQLRSLIDELTRSGAREPIGAPGGRRGLGNATAGDNATSLGNATTSGSATAGGNATTGGNSTTEGRGGHPRTARAVALSPPPRARRPSRIQRPLRSRVWKWTSSFVRDVSSCEPSCIASSTSRSGAF